MSLVALGVETFFRRIARNDSKTLGNSHGARLWGAVVPACSPCGKALCLRCNHLNSVGFRVQGEGSRVHVGLQGKLQEGRHNYFMASSELCA